jgi:2-octaprenylphenol hydroxylase
VFLETGPLAFLPLANTHDSSIVWSLPTNLANELILLDDEAFKEKLAQAFSHALGKVVEIEKRYVFPLRKQQAKCYVQPHIALVGDAAHTIHPLAGQGVNMGLLDAASLAQVISDAVHHRRDFASYATLRRYERWRKADNLTMFNGVDAIKQMFASDKKMIQSLRSQGLNVTNQWRWLKNSFMRHACGDRDGLPKIAT